jgi:hypothetical protein
MNEKGWGKTPNGEVEVRYLIFYPTPQMSRGSYYNIFFFIYLYLGWGRVG